MDRRLPGRLGQQRPGRDHGAVHSGRCLSDRPFAAPKIGHDAITADWIERKDEPGTWQAWLEPLLVHDDTAIVTGKVDYTNGNRYANLWVIRFGDDGRAAEFTEWWMDRPEEAAS